MRVSGQRPPRKFSMTCESLCPTMNDLPILYKIPVKGIELELPFDANDSQMQNEDGWGKWSILFGSVLAEIFILSWSCEKPRGDGRRAGWGANDSESGQGLGLLFLA